MASSFGETTVSYPGVIAPEQPISGIGNARSRGTEWMKARPRLGRNERISEPLDGKRCLSPNRHGARHAARGDSHERWKSPIAQKKTAGLARDETGLPVLSVEPELVGGRTADHSFGGDRHTTRRCRRPYVDAALGYRIRVRALGTPTSSRRLHEFYGDVWRQVEIE